VAVKFVLDTNVVLYLLGGRLATPLSDGEYFVSVMTELELLSYPDLSATEEAEVKELLASIEIVELTPELKQAAIQ
jgi:predicted nucleic acid-binding protein